MPAAALLIIGLAILGHLVITRASLGYGYTFGFRHHGFHILILSHGVIGLAGPILLLIFVGFTGPAVLRGGGNWSTVPLPWLIYIAVCVAAVPIGAVVLAWRNAHAVPASLRSNHASTHDSVAELGRVAAPPESRAGRVARLPWNECLQVDVTTLEIVIGRLPAVFDGMSVLHLTDLHFTGTPDHSYYEWVMDLCVAEKPDLIGLSGDISDRLDLLDWLPTTLGKLSAPLGRFFILGNHDMDCGSIKIREAMEQIGWTWVGKECAITANKGHHIVIGGHEGPWGTHRPACDDAEFANAELRIALCHAPHEMQWARHNQFDLTLAGHLHGGQIRLPFLGPIVGGRLASGLFDFPPTVLHVGRGLGALAPLRYGCRPEVTKLVLRSSS